MFRTYSALICGDGISYADGELSTRNGKMNDNYAYVLYTLSVCRGQKNGPEPKRRGGGQRSEYCL